MPAHFDLIVTADYQNRTADFTLRDSSGSQLAFRRTDFDFAKIPIGRQQGIFDLRNYVRLYADSADLAAVKEIGVCIAEDVLGQEIFEKLWESTSQRTLRIQLPGAGDSENHLAAALARVPWEIARPDLATGTETLGERNLLVRIVHDMAASDSRPIEMKPDEPLRVLFVFAEARGSRPLGARQERRKFLELFEKEIYRDRCIVAHFLTHGVTRERLEGQIRENGGYHIVHWSGHGHRNLLELCKPGGGRDHLSGNQLLNLFNEAGGFLPQLFFLSACHSGDILSVQDWNDFLAIAGGKEQGVKEAFSGSAEKELNLKEEPGFTGTAHALLQGGVPSVVAMRYAVGDDYAREMSVEFYRALLAHPQPKNAAAALTLARKAMLDGGKHEPARFAVCDHATPVLYGEDQPGLTLIDGRSPSLSSRNPRLHQITELTISGHDHFVGRTWELSGLGADFIGSKNGAKVKPVAVITGLGGMGKTALTAEALDLWDSRFEWVLLYQVKSDPLKFVDTLRKIHGKLMGGGKVYHDHVRAYPADAIYRDPSDGFTGSDHLERLTQNLLRALQDEAILLVLDNFETNLKPADPVTKLSSCQEQEWDACLQAMATELTSSPSRILITCRRPLAVLSNGNAHLVPLGPLPGAEAALYLKEHPTLVAMVFGDDPEEEQLAKRLLDASRFHPLLMDRLTKLAGDLALRPQLLAALEALEESKDLAQLPALFANPGDEKELAYLDDALVTSLDQLIAAATPEARRLLWIIAAANQPEPRGVVKGVWLGESFDQEQLRQLRQLLQILPSLSMETQEQMKEVVTHEIRAQIDALPPEVIDSERPTFDSLLAELVDNGLVREESDKMGNLISNLVCHELIRERIHFWMKQKPLDRGKHTENEIRLAYAERLAAIFKSPLTSNMTDSFESGRRALVYCVQAGDWDSLCGFAGELVTKSTELRLIEILIPHLQTAAESTPEGKQCWPCYCFLADALHQAGCHDASLPFFEKAFAEARKVAKPDVQGTLEAWVGLAVICGNWAGALLSSGDVFAARQRLLNSAEAHSLVSSPAIKIIGNELEVFRIDIIQGSVATALPEVERRLAQVETWWQQSRAGQTVPDAPDAEFLARAYIAALGIALKAHFIQKDWPSALSRIDAILDAKHLLKRPLEDIINDRMNRASVLGNMGRFGEAKSDLEACLLLSRENLECSSYALSSIAVLFNKQGDFTQAILQERRSLALREQLPNPAIRATSHENLANHLERNGFPTDIAEAPRHQLAALLYRIVVGLVQKFQDSVLNYVIAFRHANQGGTEVIIPRVGELLADPAFAALDQWLGQRQVNLNELQAEVDQYLENARLAALES